MTTNPHKPAAVVDALREILAADKLPIGFLLGAGCASSIKVGSSGGAPLIPAAKGLTDAVLDQASDTPLADPLQRLHDMLVKDGEPSPTIEHLLTRVRTMKTVVGNDQVRGFSKQDLVDLERQMCQTISTLVNKALPKPMTPYHHLARWIGERSSRSVVFTTNYDLLLEQAFESLQIPFFDGFVGSHQPFFSQQAIEQDVQRAKWALLCKLHGSINWRLVHNGNAIVRSMSGEGDELLIHPSHLKYTESRRMPYFVMLDQLKAHILNGKKSALFVVGYSFSDEHINDTIVDSLRANPSAVCYVLQYDRLSTRQQIHNLARRCSNLRVLSPDSAITDGRHSGWAECLLTQVAEFDGAFRPKCSAAKNHKQEEAERDDLAVEFCLGDFDAFGHFLASFVTRRSSHIDSEVAP